jgi:hypothetical protein
MENKVLVERLSAIEKESADLLATLDDKKAEIDREMKERQQDFDTALEKKTNDTLSRIRKEQSDRAEVTIRLQKQDTEGRITAMQQFYDEKHKEVVDGLFAEVLRS